MRRWLRSFGFAWQGVRTTIRREAHMRFHLFATFLVALMGWTLHISRTDWLFVILFVALVWTTEIINTALEILCNKVESRQDPSIKAVKDMAAGAVLVSAILALLGGILIFGPYLQAWINKN
ncbi:MAG TPA: diacylglycerol kinase family protein [Saprospiraceae bacterium]|nr:diacylglycerol kinase family protein [Saprospiraceae bacterium]HPG08109.1 diacylglycerol kinase family protein [Saprospiraceae bacterium]HRV85969.1 diacylglycerol kinase family protein [Saprospiraceae bacterium]